MPRQSLALAAWNTDAWDAFKELREAHRAIGGPGAGRRTGTQQLNYAYVLLLSARFQAYCRDLHTEVFAHIRRGVPAPLRPIVYSAATRNRALDRGNPTPGNIGGDFNRLDFRFWDAMRAADKRNANRQAKLERLCEWRNAIAHHEIANRRDELNPSRITLDVCRDWQSALNGLVRTTDKVVADQTEALTGARPW